jgi:hypothetical protein
MIRLYNLFKQKFIKLQIFSRNSDNSKYDVKSNYYKNMKLNFTYLNIPLKIYAIKILLYRRVMSFVAVENNFSSSK